MAIVAVYRPGAQVTTRTRSTTRDAGAELPFIPRERLDGAGQVHLGAPDRRGVTVTRYLMNRPGHGLTTPSPPADALMAVVHLRPCGAHAQWRDGTPVRRAPQGPGALSLFDMRHAWNSDLRDPFHTVNFHLPRPALDGLTKELEMQPFGDPPPLTEGGRDEVMLHLALALLSALESPAEMDPLFAGHVLAAIGLRLVQRYGGARPAPRRARGGLAPWQERRATEMLAQDLRGSVTVAELAAACGLSTGHFLRAFHRSVGITPHRWLQERRVATARELLIGSRHTLAEIAQVAGFADQSHFTRVFSRSVGTSPGAWRRRMG